MSTLPNNPSPTGDSIARRDVLLTGAGAVGGLLAVTDAADATARPATIRVCNAVDTLAAHEDARKPSGYDSLGVKHVINAAGTFTALGGSLMPPEVVAAWLDAARHFVDLVDLQNKVGARIAELIGVEAALVTTGAAGAMQLATAAAITRGDPEKVRRLPDTTGMKNEVITQKSHHACYDNQITACGAKLVDVETRAELERALGDRTAMMLFYNLNEPDGQIRRDEWVAVARAHDVPTLLDAAADVPPVEALSRYNKMGFDMVAFSGGKALRGPNNTGLLLGRKELIEAAKKNTNPVCGSIGRALKVGKEDMIALLAAVERYVRIDHTAEWREWEQRLGVIESTLRDVPTLRTERIIPPIANHVPHLLLFWDESVVQITRAEVTRQLAAGDPSIALGRVHGTGDAGLLVSVFMLKPEEVEVVASRLRDALRAAIR
jgi:L-seryl-tRNA(Ser) seleniumtransferase